MYFGPQRNLPVEKAERTAAALSRIMPNIAIPLEHKRRLLVSIIHSKMTYAAPVWTDTLYKNKKLIAKIDSVQRRGALRVISTFMPVAKRAMLVLASVLSIDFLAFATT